MPEAHAARRALLAAKVAAVGADAALITHLINVRYLTGLASSNAALLVLAGGGGGMADAGDPGDVRGGVQEAQAAWGAPDTPAAWGAPDTPAAWGEEGRQGAHGTSAAVLATDSRYMLAAERDCPDIELLTQRDVAAGLADLAASRGVRRIMFEAHVMTVEQHAVLAEDTVGIEFVPLGRAVEELRMIKAAHEIAAIAAACRLTCQALADVLPSIRPGITERELAVALERRMVDLGADGPGFGTIVASGPNGAIPHHVPTDRPIEPGELVTIDMGACLRGYHADMTRTFAVGEPAAWQRDIYTIVATAHEAGVDAARPGAHVAAVDAAARDLITAAGHGEHFGHGLGHGIGLEIHEAPLMHRDAAGTLRDRVPITVEPGIYVPGAGGVRIEDTLVVRAGAEPAELLTATTKDLLVL